MYCKNCGAHNNDDAKFCTSCGAPIEQQPESNYQDYYEEPAQHENYNYQENSQESMYHDNRPSNIYGKQFEPNATGNVSYGRNKGSMGKVIGFAIIVAIIAFAYFVLFNNSGPIYDVAIGAEINSETYYPDEPLDYVISSDGILYVSYSARDLLGEIIQVQIYNTDLDMLIHYEDISINYEEQVGYFSYDYYWIPGDYEILFMLDGEEIHSYTFDVRLD